MWQISYPPANGASLGSYLVKNASPEIIWVKVCDRQTDKFLTQYTGGCVFFSPVKIFYLPTRFARRGKSLRFLTDV